MRIAVATVRFNTVAHFLPYDPPSLPFVDPSRPQQGYFLFRVRIRKVRLMDSHLFHHARS